MRFVINYLKHLTLGRALCAIFLALVGLTRRQPG